MLTGYAKLFAWMLSYDGEQHEGSGGCAWVRSATHGSRLMTERVSHGDCSAAVHPRTVFGV